MASTAATADTPITVKVSIDGVNRRFRIPLRDVAPAIFVDKLSSILQVPTGKRLLLERFSDSSNSFNPLVHSNPSSYKQLYRAAKAKLKLRLRATVVEETQSIETESQPPAPPLLSTRVTAQDMLAMTTELERNMNKLKLQTISLSAAKNARATTWQVCCNNCDAAMTDVHYHCSICDDGDYDLCVSCVDRNVVCPGDNHWLIKRDIKNGKIINSTTERHSSARLASQLSISSTARQMHMPGSFGDDGAASVDVVPASNAPAEPLRTCNSCVTQLAEKMLVNCANCPDFDLCLDCLKADEHGHHPGHVFQPCSTGETKAVAEQALRLSGSGPFKRHHAICDGCNRAVYGVRHKCIDCPDWDYCGKCFEHAPAFHPGHRFVPVYETIQGSLTSKAKHFGVYCDGPLCSAQSNSSYILGVRYKCTICHDTDFCENCEAHPNNKHNATHPLIKFKSPVSGATVTTFGQTDGGDSARMGDRARFSAAPAASRPSCPVKAESSVGVREPANPNTAPAYNAHFVRETIPDGTRLQTGTVFTQSWTLVNPGPLVWPTGCGIHSTGGDRMLNIDPHVAASVEAINSASSSTLTTRPVRPGEAWTFSVQMLTPTQPGKQISYWRAKLPNGQAFGHKLWCDVQVTRLPQPTVSDAPNAHPDGQTGTTPLSQVPLRIPVIDAAHASKQGQVPISRTLWAAGVVGSSAPLAATVQPTESPELSGSQMVFPTLEKESPSSSTDQLASKEIAPVEAPVVTSIVTAPTASTEDHATQDFDNVTYVESEDEQDDLFLTDEEYDILDASDEEIMSTGAPLR